ncbi:hypothetical protein HPP92_019017 [Vanilla planifolia]|uniref:Uncharacterized protein n=1 Tax=Vanilla planifolia TaxID=51239 RepID=A0A835Q9H5_VANPL|nr:hypothetical protein HPP92_019017 [Vanilla planifolia]
MVAWMIRSPLSPINSKKFDAVPVQRAANGEGKTTVEVRWKRPKMRALSWL